MKKLFKKLALAFVAVLTLSVGTGTVREVKAADETYAKVTESLSDWSGRYLIVYESKNYAFNGNLSTIDATKNFKAVSINDNKITGSGINYYFDIEKVSGGYSICSESGNYIGRSATSNGMNITTTYSSDYVNTISFLNGTVSIKGKGGPAIQFYDSGADSRFRYYKSTQKAVALYKLLEENTESNSDKIKKNDTTASLGFDYYVPETDNKYIKVTQSLSDWTGQYLIGYEKEDTLHVFNGSLGDNIDSVKNYKVVENEDSIVKSTAEIEMYAFSFEKIENTETYSIKTSTGHYIGKTAYANGLDKNETTVYSNTISFGESGNIIITSESGCALKFNANADQMRFRFYKSGQSDIVLYKMVESSTSKSLSEPKFDNISILFGVSLSNDLFEDFETVSAGVKITCNNKTVDKTVDLAKDSEGNYVSYSVGVIFELFADNNYVTEETKDRLTTSITAQVYFIADGKTLELYSKTVTVLDMIDIYLGADYAENEQVQKHVVGLKALKAYIEA